jgi:hypothetical protein
MFALFYNFWTDASTGIIGLICTGLGILVKAGWDRWISDRTVSTQALLDRLANNQQRLSSRGRKRLQEEAESALNEWRRRLVPPTGAQKLCDWPERSESIFIRDLSASEGSSACPIGASRGNSETLFIRLETTNKVSNRYESLAAANELRRQFEAQAVNEFKERFRKLADELKLSEQLIKVGNWNKENEPKLWIVAPEMSIRSAEEAQRLLQKLAEEARSWLPSVKVVLEIYLPNIIRGQIDSHSKGLTISLNGAVSESTNINLLSSNAARYAAARNEAQNILNAGIVLGELQIPDKYSISDAVLSNRLQKYFPSGAGGVEWTTVAVSGAPGSGKTELSRLLLKEFAAAHKTLVLVFSTPKLLADLELIRTKQNHEEVFFDLAKSFCFREHLLPPRFQGTDESIEAFVDALFHILKNEKRQQAVVFVVDDLHARREIRDVLSNLRVEANERGLRFVLIGRTEIERHEDERFIAIKCETWNREQAQQILKGWIERDHHQELEIAMEEGWLAEQDKFSIYLLRIIAENIGSLASQRYKPSTLLRNAIDKHLSSVSLEIKSQPRPSSDLLLKIENMLRSGAPTDDILKELKRVDSVDLIQLFGVLSWFSHFEAQDDVLTPRTIKQWSQGIISTDEEAKDLLEAGGKAGVFNDFKGAAMWHDKLVADGCAALYLGHKVEEGELTDSIIAGMIENLNESDSIDILTLALDTPILLRIIEAVANAKPSLATKINELVTTEFILQLKRNPEWLNKLWGHLWKQGRKAGLSDMTPFSLLLARLLPLNQEFELRCRNAISKGSSEDAILALAVKASQLKDPKRFFQELEEYVPSYLSLMVIETAVRFCSSMDGRSLSNNLTKLTELGYKESDIGRIWGLWCGQKETQTIMDLFVSIDHFIEQIKDSTIHENLFRLLAEISLKEIAVNRPPAERDMHSQQIKQLKNKVIELAQKGRKLAGVISKWVAYFYNPDIIDKGSAWIVVTGNYNYAIQKRPNEPLTVAQIFAKLCNSYPHLELSASHELQHTQKSDEGHPELVRDRLRSGFSYTEEDSRFISPVNLKIWSDQLQEESFVSKDKLNTLKLVWRPRLDLMS